MNVKEFIKDKIVTITLLFFGILTIEIFLIPYPFGNFIKIYIPIIIFMLYMIGLIMEYITKKIFI